jgi:hypothetical protein
MATMADLCVKTGLPGEFCFHCLGHDDSTVSTLGIIDRHWGSLPPVLVVGRVYIAEAPCSCSLCGRTIRVGDVMGRDDQHGLNVCVRCQP